MLGPEGLMKYYCDTCDRDYTLPYGSDPQQCVYDTPGTRTQCPGILRRQRRDRGQHHEVPSHATPTRQQTEQLTLFQPEHP